MTGDEGLFGPGSVSWRIDREVVVLAAVSRRMLPLVPAPLRHVPTARTADRRVRAARPAK